MNSEQRGSIAAWLAPAPTDSMALACELSCRDATALLQAVSELAELSDVQRVIETASRSARELVAADGVTFVLKEGDQVYYAEEDAVGPLWKGKRFAIDRCASGWAMTQRRPIVIPDVTGDPRIPIDAYRPTFVKSLALIPVGQEDPTAAIGVYWAKRHTATARELVLLQRLANAAGVALHNAEQLAQAAQDRERVETLGDVLPHLIWTADANGQAKHFNTRWLEFTGLTLEQSLGQGWLRAIHPEDVPRLLERWSAAVAAQTFYEVECRIRRRGGAGHRWMLIRAVPMKRGDPTTEWVGTCTDIDALMISEEEKAEAIRERDEFLAVASHELRTPLTAVQLQIQGLVDLADRRRPTPDGRFALRLSRAAESLDRLALLVERLLDVSRITTGKVPLNVERFDVVHSVLSVVERLRERIGQEPDISVQAPDSVFGHWDRLRIEQILATLLTNAVKYGEKRPLSVEVEPSPGGVSIRVIDHGVGIPSHKLERVFERFARAAPARHYGGLGLGLYSARLIAQAHNGTVRASETPGGGATLTVFLPFDQSAPSEPSAEA